MSRFLQMAPGGYGEGDRAIGVPVPEQRRVAGRYWRDLSLAETAMLLKSGVHEERLTSLFILVRKFTKGDEEERGRIFRVILANTSRIDNWDLVDSSAPYIVGPWLLDKDRSVLDRLAESSLVWDRRIAVMATFAFIRAGDFHWTFRLVSGSCATRTTSSTGRWAGCCGRWATVTERRRRSSWRDVTGPCRG